jgi:hypothetical protein
MEEYEHHPVSHPDTRKKELPRFIQYPGTHPLWTHGTAYVYQWDTSVGAQYIFREWARTREVTGRFEHELEAQGEMQLKPNEAVFARHIGKYIFLFFMIYWVYITNGNRSYRSP